MHRAWERTLLVWALVAVGCVGDLEPGVFDSMDPSTGDGDGGGDGLADGSDGDTDAENDGGDVGCDPGDRDTATGDGEDGDTGTGEDADPDDGDPGDGDADGDPGDGETGDGEGDGGEGDGGDDDPVENDPTVPEGEHCGARGRLGPRRHHLRGRSAAHDQRGALCITGASSGAGESSRKPDISRACAVTCRRSDSTVAAK